MVYTCVLDNLAQASAKPKHMIFSNNLCERWLSPYTVTYP